MIKIYPFRPLMPSADDAAQIACEPYDVISGAEARTRSAGNSKSFLHVVRSEIDTPEGSDPYDKLVYQKAAENLEQLIANGSLVEADEDGIYVYRQTFQERQQFGVVCCYDVQQYRDDQIKKHEKTRPDKEDDRTRHLTTCSAHAEPVFLTFQDDAAVEALIQRDAQARPLIDFQADDGVAHTIWKVADPESYVSAFAQLESVYIADGHHRTAAGERAATQRQSENSGHTGGEQYNRVLSVMFPAGHLKILPYNRVVDDLNGLSPEAFIAALSKIGRVEATANPEPDAAGVICCYVDGQWYRFQFDNDSIDHSDPIQSLDVALLQSRVLEPVLAVGDPRTDKRIGFVGGIRGTQHLQDLVDSAERAVAFSMYATSIEQLINVSDAGKIMPPKSTWFEPKLRSGLFVHRFERFSQVLS